ncbi:MAG: lysoplasmalogenase family protein [Cognatishimia sp.]|uniref:lysoplasmalogenase family protein n=1 Tax=Cognatishimia sp. TaxID=2211648 RepID=UPI0040586996
MTVFEEIALRQTLFWGGLVAAIGIGGLYSILACYRVQSWWRTVFKALPLIALLFAASANFAAPLVIVGLALSLVGDIALSRDGERAFLVGLIGFALAHVAYIYHFYTLSAVPVPLLGAVLVALLALSTEVWLAPYTGDLKWPVRIYVVLIALMGVLALTLEARMIATYGALAFIASDCLLAIQLFRMRDGAKLAVPVSILLWVLYLAAQIGILLGAGFAQPLVSL